MSNEEALVIANRIVMHFESIGDVMHTHSKEALPEVIALRDWVASQQSVHVDASKVVLNGRFRCPECHCMDEHNPSCSRQ